MSVTRSQSQLTARSEWLSTLHCACRTLSRTRGEAVRSVSVTARVLEGPDAGWSLLDLAHRIADEYSVWAQECHEGTFLTVRFQRPAGYERER